MRSRGVTRNGLLLVIFATCAVLAVLNLLLMPPPRVSDGDAGPRNAGASDQALLKPGGAGALAAAPGADPTAREARERARREAAAAPSFAKSEGVFGFVLDGRGTPVPKATVKLLVLAKDDLARPQPSPDPEAVATATSGEDGAYLVGPAPPGMLRLRAEAEGFAPTVQQVTHRGTRVDLTLDRGGELRVRVLDAEGAPVAEAEVVHTAGTVVSTTATGPDGRAVFASVPTGQGALLVTKAGHGAARRPDVAVAPGGALDVTVLLGRPFQMNGKVVAGVGDRPVTGAVVKLVYPYFTQAAPPEPLTTDADGAFRFEVPMPLGEQLLVEASSEGEGVGRTWTNVSDSGGGTMEVVVKLASEGTSVTGRVVDARGQPAEGVQVTLAWQQPGTKTPETRTDGDGAFELSLPPGTQAGSWWQVVALSETLGMAGGQTRLPAKPGDRVEPLVLTLSGSGTVSGRVVREGTPVEGALVALSIDWSMMRAQRGRGGANWMLMNLLQDPRRAAGLSAVSDADGRFVIPGVPAATFRGTATHGLDTATVPEPIVVGAGGTVEVEITLGQGLTIEGTVVDDAGSPVAGAWVNASLQAGRTGGMGARHAGARSQSDGTFVLRGLSDGSWNLQAWAAGFTSQAVPAQSPGTRDVIVRLVALGWIEGVLEEGGRPYQGAFTVTVSQAQEVGKGREEMFSGPNEQAFNTDDGRFEVRGLASGTWLLQARTPDGRITRQAARVDVMNGRGTTGVGLSLALGATITGVVTNEETGKPVAGTTLHAGGKDRGQGPRTGAGGTVDAAGRFSIRGLAPGAYVLYVNPPSGVNWQEEVEVREGETKELRLVERSPGKARVFVVDTDQAPLSGAQPVLANQAGGQVWPSWQAMQREGLMDLRGGGGDPWQRMLQTDASGVNLRHHVPPGRYQVSANLQGYVLEGEAPWIEVAPGRVTEVTVVLRRAEAPTPDR